MPAWSGVDLSHAKEGIRAEGLVCVGEGEMSADARRIAGLQKPDILILGVIIPGGAIEAAQAILSAHHHTKVLILTASGDEVYLQKALKAGVRAYVLKGISGSELVRIYGRCTPASSTSLTP